MTAEPPEPTEAGEVVPWWSDESRAYDAARRQVMPTDRAVAALASDLCRIYRDAGAVGVMERRAVALGAFASYVEGIIAGAPARVVDLGVLLTRLIEAERRCYQAARAFGTEPAPRRRTLDLAQLAEDAYTE